MPKPEPPAPRPAPGSKAGQHRRTSSLKATALNIIRNNKSSSVPLRRTVNDLKISSPIGPVHEESLAASILLNRGPSPVADEGNTGSEIGWTLKSGKSIGTASYRSQSISEGPMVGMAVSGPDIPSPPASRASGEGNGAGDDSSFGKGRDRSATKTGSKLRGIAMNLLRRRSNPNMKKDFAITERDKEEKDDKPSKIRLTLKEALSEPRKGVDTPPPSATHPPRRSPSPDAVSMKKSSSQKISLPPRAAGHTRNILTKTPSTSSETRRRRRATVASGVFDLMSESSVEPDWTIPTHTKGSQSVKGDSPLTTNFLGNDSQSVFSRESTHLGGGGSLSPGGLFPRPASLSRNWSDQAPITRHRANSSVHTTNLVALNSSAFASRPIGSGSPPIKNQARRVSTAERTRPVSFSGISNSGGYGNMRITDALSLETRVKDLETQVASMRSLLTQHGHFAPEQPTDHTSTVGEKPDRTLQQPFDETHFDFGFKPEDESSLSLDRRPSSTRVSPAPSVAGFSSSPRTSIRKNHKRARTLQALEGLTFSSSSKRNTMSTIKARSSNSNQTDNDSSPPPSPKTVTLAEYKGLITLFNREKRARRRLELQVANLQEQMASVLHRHLISQNGTTSSTVSNATFNSLGPDNLRKSSHRQSSGSSSGSPETLHPTVDPNHHFAEYHSDVVTSDDEDDDEEEQGSRLESMFLSKEQDQASSDVWETPAEERTDVLGAPDESEEDLKIDASSLFEKRTRPRTMSLSKLTQRPMVHI